MPLGRGALADVTLLFADVRGFSHLVRTEPPERVVARLNRYFSTVTDVLLQYDACIDKLLGDGVMAVFGAPIQRADHPRAAVQAACEIADLLRTQSTDGQPLQVGIGLHRGTALVGNLGAPGVQDFTVIGEAVVLAERVQHFAAPGQVVCTEPVYRAVEQDFPAARERKSRIEGWPGHFRIYTLRDAPA